MGAELLAALEHNPVAEALRLWRWAYPLASAAHVLGIALLFGAIVPLDLRLLGLRPRLPVADLARALVPVAACGVALALSSGLLLFLVEPARYALTGLFQLKLALIALALLNILAVHRSRAWRRLTAGERDRTIRLWPGAALSLSLWLSVILCGRFIAYL